LIRLRPDEAAAHHNLGTLLLREGRLVESVKAYETAAALRPNYFLTWLYLGWSHRQAGNVIDAHTSFSRAAQVASNDEERREADRYLSSHSDVTKRDASS
jgi:Flp pilus assembly protein TadD